MANRNQTNNDSEVPSWASFFNESEYTAFLIALEKYFKAEDISWKLHDGYIEAETEKLMGGKMGLGNLSQACKQAEIADYPEIVSGHFNMMMRGKEFNDNFEKNIHDFDKIKDYLGVRLYPDDYVNHLGKDLILGREFAGNVYTTLVFDMPEGISSIKPEDARKWGRSEDELIEIGIANSRKNYESNISEMDLGEFKIWFVQGDHFFVPNILFDMEHYPEFTGPHGAIVGIPHRHVAIIYPIKTIELVNAINQLFGVIYGMHSDGPGSISNHIFWYKDGTFTDLPFEVTDQEVSFNPPESFVQLLNGLASEN